MAKEAAEMQVLEMIAQWLCFIQGGNGNHRGV
jgi:hypothetical protein